LKRKPAPLHNQVIFITGATSGIGLATVKMAVREGSKVFMVARNEEDLQTIQDEMRAHHYQTAYAIADVAEYDQLLSAAEKCMATFGRIDTWINNAGITIFGTLLDTTEEEAKRLFDTNFWGVVNGCKIAVPLMRSSGGNVITVGSILAKIADPDQGMYTASEHAIKGYIDSLRLELQAENAPIDLSLIFPTTVDTPFFENARTHSLQQHSTVILSTPEEVAKVILGSAIRPAKQKSVGSTLFLYNVMAKSLQVLRNYPRLLEGLGHLSANPFSKQTTAIFGGMAFLGSLFAVIKKKALIGPGHG
jgi:short-subunit dehydrogenase